MTPGPLVVHYKPFPLQQNMKPGRPELLPFIGQRPHTLAECCVFVNCVLTPRCAEVYTKNPTCSPLGVSMFPQEEFYGSTLRVGCGKFFEATSLSIELSSIR